VKDATERVVLGTAAASGTPPRERLARFERLVELSPDGILVHDGEHITSVNAAFARLAGATKSDQLVGLPVDMLLRPPHLKAVQDQLTGALRDTEVSPAVRDTVHRLDGGSVEVEVRAVVFLDHDQPSAHLVVRDITARLAAEETARELTSQLQQTQKLEAVGAMAGGVAHEVNNMLQVILGFGGLLLEEPSMSPECRTDVREILTAAEHAASVTRQLLEFSRHAAHQPTFIDLGATIRRIEPVLRRLVGEGRRFSYDEMPGVTCLMDSGQLEQVVVNLVLNARHATPVGGSISLTVGATHVRERRATADGPPVPLGYYATLAVRDTGVGMDPFTRARIFEPFFTTKPSGEGTGLGLAAVQGILAQNHALITVETAIAGGSTFTVYFPAAVGANFTSPPARGVSRAVTPVPDGLTVLIVDDEPSVRAVAARLLRAAGYRVLLAVDGASALEIVERHGPPHLVLSDLMMPDMDGGELSRRLAERWPTLPMLFMSGYPADVMQRETAVSGTRGLIEKPFTASLLVARVASLVGAGPHRPSPAGLPAAMA
jgi:two-component system cell cycle sensor histidine kinase/response regulator CckA